MADNFAQTGVVQVNGAWATSIKYSAQALGPDTETVDLKFMQGRAEVARAAVTRSELAEVLGEANRQAIERQLSNNADKYLPVVTGELKGSKLTFREVVLPNREPSAENTLARARAPEQREPADREPKDDRDTRTRPSPESAEAPSGRAAEAPTDREESREDEPRANTPAVPPHIAAKYLVKGDAYHFDDQTLAFVDRGTALTVKTHNQAVIQDVIAIAQAREWGAVTVSGTKEFRREAWKAATAAGLPVSGYSPSELERLAAERQRDRRAGRDQSDAKPNDRSSDVPRPAAERRSASVDTPAALAVRYGTLVDHGEAPYRHDPRQQSSYFVTLREEDGQEHTAWGTGLKAALRNAKTAPVVGDVVGIRRTGSTPVTVAAMAVDEHGEVTTQTKEAKRQNWEVEKAAYFKAAPDVPVSPASRTRDQEVAAAIRSAATTREELQLKYPELNKAVFQHLASHDQFAEAYVRSGLIREADRAQVIEQMRERLARQIERGQEIREPDNEQVNLLIRRSVNRVAADIGRPPLDMEPPTSMANAPPTPVREDVQVRA